MGTDASIICSIYQHGKLYKCEVCANAGDIRDLGLLYVFADKIDIKYNTKNKNFTVTFYSEKIRVSEAHANKIYIYDLEEDNKVQLPSYDGEWPYDDIFVEMKEE